MSRQAMTYTVPQPLEPLNVEELKFWLQIMQEHALFIRAGLPSEDSGLIDEAQNFYREFGAFLQRVEKVKSIKQGTELVSEVYTAVKEFYCYKRELLQTKLACRLGGSNFPLFLDHISREAEYFLRLLDRMRSGRVILKESSQTQETVFWLRLMADHAKLISHLLDPTERGLIRVANEFSVQFDQLVLQGRDFASMLHVHEGEVRAFRRFILDVRTDVQQLRDFNKAAHDLIVECRLIGIMPEKLADHLRREAEHFLMLLAMMERGLMKHSDEYYIEDVPCIDDEYAGAGRENDQAGQSAVPEENHRPPASPKSKGYKAPKFGAKTAADEHKDAGTGDQPEQAVIEHKASPAAADEQKEREEAGIAGKPKLKTAKAVKETEEKEQVAKAVQADTDKIMGKASTYKEAAGKQTAAKSDAEAQKPEASKTKYKWGGSFPRSLGKVKN